jgi:para-nitrobenzyl esterase
MTIEIQTRYGKVAGVREDGLEVFRGIPYAKPPVGPLRFRAPEPPEPWSGLRDASAFGGSAPQNKLALDALPGMDVGPQSEDCLYLNVWTPATDDARRPVMVWIHGGAFVIGSGSQVLYEGSALAKRGDVVVVTINYRLGALGFLHLNDLCGEEVGASPNAGILDQIAALGWVRDHVAHFGGDPENVTIFGESAGGMSVGTLLAAPAARGLFRRAIPQSGAGHHAHTRAVASSVAERFLGELGIAPADAASLREVPVQRILEAQERLMLSAQQDPFEGPGLTLGPVADGHDLPERPIERIRQGSADGVDVLIGSTRDEWKLFAPMDVPLWSLDASGLRARMEHRVPGRDEGGTPFAARLVEAYGKAREGRADTTPRDLFLALETDRMFRLPAVRLAEAQAARGGNVYAYLLEWESPLLGGSLGACHAIDLPFVFGTAEHAELFVGSGPEVARLEERMMDAWLAFARGGDPSCDALGAWPRYDAERRRTMILGPECRVVEDPAGAERAAWEGAI